MNASRSSDADSHVSPADRARARASRPERAPRSERAPRPERAARSERAARPERRGRGRRGVLLPQLLVSAVE
ncbi:hypothetical protein, partial [Rhodococcus gordoniae]|uniref:hypothetical protein n=2 Tax=Rhodococcus TaxID=1827 RepID=UPI0035243B0C